MKKVGVCASNFCPVCFDGNPFSDKYDNEVSWNENKFELDAESIKRQDYISYEKKTFVQEGGEHKNITKIDPHILHTTMTNQGNEIVHWMCSECAKKNEVAGKATSCFMCRDNLPTNNITTVLNFRTESLLLKFLQQDNNKNMQTLFSTEKNGYEFLWYLVQNDFCDTVLYVNSIKKIHLDDDDCFYYFQK
jgi:hypothetical protein